MIDDLGKFVITFVILTTTYSNEISLVLVIN